MADQPEHTQPASTYGMTHSLNAIFDDTDGDDKTYRPTVLMAPQWRSTYVQAHAWWRTSPAPVSACTEHRDVSQSAVGLGGRHGLLEQEKHNQDSKSRVMNNVDHATSSIEDGRSWPVLNQYDVLPGTNVDDHPSTLFSDDEGGIELPRESPNLSAAVVEQHDGRIATFQALTNIPQTEDGQSSTEPSQNETCTDTDPESHPPALTDDIGSLCESPNPSVGVFHAHDCAYCVPDNTTWDSVAYNLSDNGDKDATYYSDLNVEYTDTPDADYDADVDSLYSDDKEPPRPRIPLKRTRNYVFSTAISVSLYLFHPRPGFTNSESAAFIPRSLGYDSLPYRTIGARGGAVKGCGRAGFRG